MSVAHSGMGGKHQKEGQTMIGSQKSWEGKNIVLLKLKKNRPFGDEQKCKTTSKTSTSNLPKHIALEFIIKTEASYFRRGVVFWRLV